MRTAERQDVFTVGCVSLTEPCSTPLLQRKNMESKFKSLNPSRSYFIHGLGRKEKGEVYVHV